MDARELEIGDIVSTPNGYRKIEELSIKCSLLNWEDYGCTIDEVRPVKLTKEIMQLNGFDGGIILEARIGGYDFEVCLSQGIPSYAQKVGNGWNYCLPYTKYVHELQHMFRGLGLREFADGFKVE